MSAMVRLVRAELLKIRTTRAWWALLIGVALATAGFVALQGVIALLGLTWLLQAWGRLRLPA